MSPSLKCLIAIAALIIATTASATVQHTIGLARDSDNQSLRYIEHHQYFEDGRHLISYYSPDQELIATKRLQYGEQPQQPTLVQQNLVEQTEITMRPADGHVAVTRRTPDEQETLELPLSPDTVIDAAFDAYVRDAWDDITADSPARVDFAIAGQSRTLPMTIRRESDNTRHFSVKPSNWFLRQIIPPIKLEYDSNQRLSRYRGLSNIKSSEGGSGPVTIDFAHYQLETGLDTPPAAWVQALAN